jgi:hypothetical protein
MQLEERGVSYLDVLLALLLFAWPPMTIWIILGWRELKRLREERNRIRLDAEAMAAEGFPPPGPPTTDQPGAEGE